MEPAAMNRLAPADVGGLLDRVFRTYLGNFAQMLGTVAIVYVPFIALIMFWQRVLMDRKSLAQAAVGLLGVLVWAYVFMPLATGAITHAVSEEYLGRRISIGESYSRALTRLGSIIGSGFLVGLVVGFGALLCLVPGVLFALSYAVTFPVVVIEGLGATASMERSKQLADGHRWRILGVFFVLILIPAVANLGTTMIYAMLGGRPFQPGGTQPLALEVIQQVVGLLATPLTSTGAVLVYYDLRVRKEGFDLEMLSRALSGQPAIPATPLQPPPPPPGPAF